MSNGVKFLAVMCFVAMSWTAAAADGDRDGYVFRGGKVLVFKEGKESVVTAEVKLRNGARILPDGFIVFVDGRRERFVEDRWLSFEGEYIVVAATDDVDGYWFEGGKVYVMRERHPVVVTTAVTLNDGSRIEPSGVLIYKDGRREQLTAGIRITNEGKRVEHKGGAAAQGAVDTREKPIDTSKKVEDTAKPPQAEQAKTTEKQEDNPANRQEKREGRQENRAEKRDDRQEKRDARREER